VPTASRCAWTRSTASPAGGKAGFSNSFGEALWALNVLPALWQAGSHLLRISDPGLAHFYQFAVRAPDGSERVVLTNVSSVARTIGVTPRAPAAPDHYRS
jgi:hypothetical protein